MFLNCWLYSVFVGEPDLNKHRAKEKPQSSNVSLISQLINAIGDTGLNDHHRKRNSDVSLGDT